MYVGTSYGSRVSKSGDQLSNKALSVWFKVKDFAGGPCMTWRSSLEGGVTSTPREINCNQAPDLCVCNQRPANQLQSTGDRVSRWDEGTGHLNWGLSANLKEEIVGRGTSGQFAKTVMDFKQRNVDTVTFKRCFSSKRMVNMVFVTFVRLCCSPVWAWWNQKARFDWRVD